MKLLKCVSIDVCMPPDVDTIILSLTMDECWVFTRMKARCRISSTMIPANKTKARNTIKAPMAIRSSTSFSIVDKDPMVVSVTTSLPNGMRANTPMGPEWTEYKCRPNEIVTIPVS